MDEDYNKVFSNLISCLHEINDRDLGSVDLDFERNSDFFDPVISISEYCKNLKYSIDSDDKDKIKENLVKIRIKCMSMASDLYSVVDDIDEVLKNN